MPRTARGVPRPGDFGGETERIMHARMARAADVIYLARKTRGFSQKELARLSGVAQPKISAYERGEVEPRYEVVERLVGHCGLKLTVRLADDSYPTLPQVLGRDRLLDVQWAIARSPRDFDLLDVRAVPAPMHSPPTVLVRTKASRWTRPGWQAGELGEYLYWSVGRVHVLDLATLSADRQRELLEASVPLAFVGRKRPPRETRFVPPTDDRWYGTELVNALPGTLYGPPAHRRRDDPPFVWLRYRRVQEAEEKAIADEERIRAADERARRRLDDRLSDVWLLERTRLPVRSS